MITEKELILDNVVCYSARGTETKIEDARERIQNALFERNAFMTSPGILRRFVDKEMTVVQMMCAVDKRIIIDDEKFVFWDHLRFEHCLFLRILNEDDNLKKAEKELYKEIERRGLLADNEGCLYLYNKIPGGSVIDLFLPFYVMGREDDK